MADVDPAPWLPIDACLAQAATAEANAAGGVDVERKRLAVASYVEQERRDLFVADVFTPPAHVVEGAVLMVARLVARKGAPLGVASYGDFGPADIVRFDPDVERLLGVGRYAKPIAQ